MSKKHKPRYNDLYPQDLAFIANVIKKFVEADNGPDGHDGDSHAYIAAETPATPIWRTCFGDNDRILLGHVVKQDLGLWSFEPASRSAKVEVFA